MLRARSWSKLVWASRNFANDYSLPLPAEQTDVYKCLPEYILEDIADHFKFIFRNAPHVITSTQTDELIVFCIVFLTSSDYIKNPGVKSGLISILYFGIWPIYNRQRGVLGDALIGDKFANDHLLHALMKYFIGKLAPLILENSLIVGRGGVDWNQLSILRQVQH